MVQGYETPLTERDWSFYMRGFNMTHEAITNMKNGNIGDGIVAVDGVPGAMLANLVLVDPDVDADLTRHATGMAKLGSKVALQVMQPMIITGRRYSFIVGYHFARFNVAPDKAFDAITATLTKLVPSPHHKLQRVVEFMDGYEVGVNTQLQDIRNKIKTDYMP